MLTAQEAVEQTQYLLEVRRSELRILDPLHSYWRGKQPHPSVPQGARDEVKILARMSRVNICRLVVAVPAQSMSVLGFRDPDSAANDPVWSIWQANKLDRGQKPIYRATFAYGLSYATALPGEPQPVVTGHSPRRMTAVYGVDPDWPEMALQVIPHSAGNRYRLFDSTHVYELYDQAKSSDDTATEVVFDMAWDHGAAVCPVVRFVNSDDLENEPDSEIAAIQSLQDQLDETTFDLKVAERYAAFRQRYIIGWTTDSEAEAINLSQQRMMTIDADPAQVKVDEFDQTDLKGYLDSRRATLENFGIVSQVPPHNLVGQMINLSAEALVAAEVGHNRKMDDRETSIGESWEQLLRLAASYDGVTVSDSAQVRWRDSEARSLSQTVDALGKMAQMLKVPPQVLWGKIPGVTDQDVTDWRAELTSSDPVAQLLSEIERQATPVDGVNG